MSQPLSRMDRREAIKWMIAAAGTVSMLDAQAFGVSNLPSRIGSDPNLLKPVVPWSRTLTPPQLRTAAAVCDVLIPADEKSPAASAVGVVDFIDEWVSAPYEQQEADGKIVREGLAWIDAESQKRFQKEFAALDEPQKHAIADDVCDLGKAKAEFKAGAVFFAKMRSLTIGAFYSTTEGMKDIQYVGNVPLAVFEGATPAALKHLGLAD
jgi:hypothetical protein